MPLLLAENRMENTYIAAVTITGLAVVFLGLIILVLFLKGMGLIFSNKKPKAQRPAAQPSKPQPLTTAPVSAQSAVDSDEVIAVIAAAVAALGETDQTSYRIRSIRPAQQRSDARAAWTAAARRDAVTPF